MRGLRVQVKAVQGRLTRVRHEGPWLGQPPWRRSKMADGLASGYRVNQRRQFIEYFAFMGLSSSLLPGVLWAKLQEQRTQKITGEMLREAEEISGLHFTDAQRDMMLKGVNENLHMYEELRKVHLNVTIPPA